MTLLNNGIVFLRTYWPYVLLSLLLVRLVRNRYKNGLNNIPGPFLASITSLWFFIHVVRGHAVREDEMHRNYKSPIVRIGPNAVSICSASAVREIYGFKRPFHKGKYYQASTQSDIHGKRYQTLIAAISEEEHGSLRRPLANAFSMSMVVNYEPLVDSTFRSFVKAMNERFVVPNKICPLHQWLQFFAFDTIGEMTFGKPLGFLESGQDVGNMIYYTTVMFNYSASMGYMTFVDKYIRLKNPFLNKYINTPIIQFTVQQIRDHQKNQHELGHPDLVTQFTKAGEKFPIMDEDRIAENARSTIAAGSDTTGIVFRTMVYQLCTKPRVYEKFIAEIKQFLQARPRDEHFEEPFRWSEVHKMPYLQAIIKEALRFHSPLSQILPREVPAGGATICGRFFPPGVQVGCNSWIVQRDPELFGDNADEFYPERWLESPPDVVAEMEATSLAFGGGTRVCVGKNIALLEMSKFLPQFFRVFQLELVDPTKFEFVSGLLTTQTGLDVRLSNRDQKFWLEP